VKVIEGRQISAGSAATVNPVVQIKLLGKVDTTSIAKATLNPWFDEEFYFYASMRPAELFQENLTFEVLRLRAWLDQLYFFLWDNKQFSYIL
jgi:Ca2+-dependent lipid-binding protein